MVIEDLIKFAQLLNKFRETERTILIEGSERPENDTEHSFQLAMCAWYLISTQKLKLDAHMAMKYGLVHDLVEIYAGDVFFYDQIDPEVSESKKIKEREAMEKLRKDFPEFPEMADLLDGYQNLKDEESKFVYALDKIISPINLYLDGGRTWKKHGISFEMHHTNKKEKVKAHPEVEKYYNQLVEILEKEKENLFHN